MEAKNEGSAENINTQKPKMVAKNIPPPLFTKEQLVRSGKYSDNKDLLNALLEDGHSYTSEEVEGIMQAFHEKGGV